MPLDQLASGPGDTYSVTEDAAGAVVPPPVAAKKREQAAARAAKKSVPAPQPKGGTLHNRGDDELTCRQQLPWSHP